MRILDQEQIPERSSPYVYLLGSPCCDILERCCDDAFENTADALCSWADVVVLAASNSVLASAELHVELTAHNHDQLSKLRSYHSMNVCLGTCVAYLVLANLVGCVVVLPMFASTITGILMLPFHRLQ
jgi:hypothetical protein